MNSVNLVGRLVKDPQMRYTSSGTAVCDFVIAVDRILSHEKKEEYKQKGLSTADFPKVITWGKTAESASRFLEKGQRVSIEGNLQTGHYEKNGIKIFTCDVVATHIGYLDKSTSKSNKENEDDELDLSLFETLGDDEEVF